MTRQPDDQVDPQEVEKKPYTTPTLRRIGAVEDVTQLAPVVPGTDTALVLGTH